MAKRFWKPRFRVVPGTNSRIWYMIQYVAPGGHGSILHPKYHFYKATTLKWFQERGMNFSHKGHAKTTLNYSNTYSPYWQEWKRTWYIERFDEWRTKDLTSLWSFNRLSDHRAIINFLIDEGYGYAKPGTDAGAFRRPRASRRLGELEDTLADIAICGCS